MVRFHFFVEDLASTRFAISPSSELVSSLRLLRDPGRGPLHLAWISRVRGELPRLPLATALALVPPRGYIPDFLTPPPSGPLAHIDEDLEQMRATPLAQVRKELGLLLGKREPPPSLRGLHEGSRRALDELVDALAAYWRLTLEPEWPRLRAFLEADVQHRARRLAEGGPAALFAELHPGISWHGDRLDVTVPHEADVWLRGRGLLLIPSAFRWQGPAVINEAPWQPTVLYPGRGIGTLWEEPARGRSQALGALLGGTRARVLAACDAPRSTSELAARLGVSPGGVSQHLGVLRAAGLVSAERDGRSVLYVRTAVGDALVGEGA